MAFDNKNEKLNSEGINEAMSKFYITINSVEFTDSKSGSSAVSVALRYEDVLKRTKKLNSGFVWNEKFEL